MRTGARNRDRATEGLLFIAGESADATKAFDALCGDGPGPAIERALTLTEGLARLTQPGITSIVLSLCPPDRAAIDTVDRAVAAAGGLPILVLCGLGDESLGALAVERGADDFILADHFDRYSLTRAVTSLREHRTSDDALFEEKERAEVTLNSIGDAVLCTDVSGNVTYLNAVAEAMTGWQRTEAAGHPLSDIFHIVDGSTGEPAQNPMDLAVQQNRTVSLTENCVLVRRDGYECAIEDSAAPIHARAGQIVGAVIVFHDVSDARQMSLRLTHLSQHDVLTDLPNRTLLRDRLRQAVTLAKRQSTKLAVLFLDLDRFKYVNDSLGHQIGDRLLKEVARRLTQCVRESDTVARQSGDEFAIVLGGLESADSAAAAAAKLLAALTVPYQIGLHRLRVTMSIGVSIYPTDTEDSETLLSHADTAMYCAKENGRNNVQCFNQTMVARAADRQFIEAGLRGALDRGEFSLHYQPKIDLMTHAVVGVEALLRWSHPERGFIPPGQFIPIAEDTGLILPIGLWVLREACRQSRAWLDAGLPALPIAVNISAIEFRSPEFAENVRTVLEETGLAPQSLELELTEGVLMRHGKSTVPVLKRLKKIGVKLTVDDFGTAYSSLSYLRQFPIDCLKVDQSFVHEIPRKQESAGVVRAVIDMGNRLNKPVVAEGVETQEQLDFLTEAGCEEGQGFYFRAPMAAEDLGALIGASGVGMSSN